MDSAAPAFWFVRDDYVLNLIISICTFPSSVGIAYRESRWTHNWRRSPRFSFQRIRCKCYCNSPKHYVRTLEWRLKVFNNDDCNFRNVAWASLQWSLQRPLLFPSIQPVATYGRGHSGVEPKPEDTEPVPGSESIIEWIEQWSRKFRGRRISCVLEQSSWGARSRVRGRSTDKQDSTTRVAISARSYARPLEWSKQAASPQQLSTAATKYIPEMWMYTGNSNCRKGDTSTRF